MERKSNLHDCKVGLFQVWKLFQPLSSMMIIVFSLALFFSLCSCASTKHATYEHQRRGLLMMEGEHIYKNKGFYHSKKSNKRRKKTMKAHRKSYRR
jgi:hypothetical protein